MGCGRGITWDVSGGWLVHVPPLQFQSTHHLAAHIIKRANQGYPDAIAALLECANDPILQVVLGRAPNYLLEPDGVEGV